MKKINPKNKKHIYIDKNDIRFVAVLVLMATVITLLSVDPHNIAAIFR